MSELDFCKLERKREQLELPVILAQLEDIRKRTMPKRTQRKGKRDSTWEKDLAQVLKNPALGSQLVSEWTAILAKDGQGISELLVRLLIVAESAGNWQRRAAMAEAQLEVANKELSKRWKKESEIGLNVWKEQHQFRERVERQLETQIRFWRQKAELLEAKYERIAAEAKPAAKEE